VRQLCLGGLNLGEPLVASKGVGAEISLLDLPCKPSSQTHLATRLRVASRLASAPRQAVTVRLLHGTRCGVGMEVGSLMTGCGVEGVSGPSQTNRGRARCMGCEHRIAGHNC